jgi:Protein of unknown function, DUF547
LQTNLIQPTFDRISVGRRFGRRLGILAAAAFVLGFTALVEARDDSFDQTHTAWDALLHRHVSWNMAGTASSVHYKGFAADRAALKSVLDQYSSVTKGQYEAMRRDEKLAFLINAYNAFTVELILTKYPEVRSIKEIGGVFTKPWSIRFIKLLGEEKHLDHIEHDMIRAKGVFDEPRIHFVVNCAAVGCPALRPEAMTANRLDYQLEDSTRRFLRDKTRNRFNPATGKLEVSKIFDWYKADFQSGFKGINSRRQFFAKYADLFSEDQMVLQTLRDANEGLGFLDYDWSLNDKK